MKVLKLGYTNEPYGINITVLVDGSIGKCTVYYDNEKMRVGTLTHEGLIEHNSNYQYWERRIDEQCKSCNILPLCKNQTCKAPLILNGNKSCRREYILQLIEGELNNATQ